MTNGISSFCFPARMNAALWLSVILLLVPPITCQSYEDYFNDIVYCTCEIRCCPEFLSKLSKRSVSQAFFDMAHVRHKRCCGCTRCQDYPWMSDRRGKSRRN
ncbi:uncharacterized protein LOC124287266 [Haliotis rubra]|uniref:uncharacterized protein LOC124287266 n=1 Tax=Haliotis rubra TaxID=36100 RepID=UPI001EE6049C|nr:uncharacterized protein LOC124287266 [Haliotis rubra]